MEESNTKTTTNNSNTNTSKTDSKTSSSSPFKQKLQAASKNRTVNFVISTFTKPATTIKEHIAEYSDFKSTWQLPLFTAIASTILSLINIIFSKIYTAPHKTIFGKQVTASWNWKNLEDFNWLQAIGNQFIAFFLPLLAVAAIYYIISLVFKKTSNFFRLVTILTVSAIPGLLAAFIISPLISLLSPEFGIVITLTGLSYTSIIAYEALNSEIGYKDNDRIFANLIFITVVYVIFLALFSYILKSTFSGNNLPFNPLIDLLK